MNRRSLIASVPRSVRRGALLLLLLIAGWRVLLRAGSALSSADAGDATALAGGGPLEGHYALLVAVTSSPGNFRERDMLRRTWLRAGAGSGRRVAHRFFVGRRWLRDEAEAAALALSDDERGHESPAELAELRRRLAAEAEAHGDVVLLDEFDTYNRLPRKVLGALRWAAEQHGRNCTFEYVLKTDDDSFVRLDRLAAQLAASGAPRDAYWGFFNFGSAKTKVDESANKAKQRRAAKWTDPVFNGTHYPPYALGTAYALALPLAARVVRHYDRVYAGAGGPPSRMEDAATGIYVDEAPGSVSRIEVWWRSVPAVKSGSRSALCQEPMVVRSHVHELGLMRRWQANLDACGRMCSCDAVGSDVGGNGAAIADAVGAHWRPETDLDYTHAQLRWIGKRKEVELQRLRLVAQAETEKRRAENS